MAEGIRNCVGFAQYAAAAGVRSLADTPATGVKAPDNAYSMTIQVEGQAIRWRDDGNAPTAAIGMVLPVSGPPSNLGFGFHFEGDLDKFRWIEMVAGAIVNITYWGMG